MEGAEIREEVARTGAVLVALENGLNQVLLGKDDLVRDLVTGVLAGGHILLEGLPGLGKTELVKGLARLCAIQFKRIQFTPDLLPSDVTGSFILQQEEGRRDFLFREGPVFTNLLLGDEINRASPKTQSALLEAMAERSVTVMGETRALPCPFFVAATQNPIELEGTYPLPEAQVDRFLFKLRIRRPPSSVLSGIVRDRADGAPPRAEPVLSREQLLQAMGLVDRIYISGAVADFIAALVEASHPDGACAPDLVKKYVRFGASPRAAIALGRAARSRALAQGRVQAGFDGVRALFGAVMNHRIILDYTARVDGVSIDDVMAAILDSVSEEGQPLPAGVQP